LRRGCLKQHGSDRLEVKRSLNAGLNASGDENSFKPAVSKLGRIGVECVLPGIERGEAEDSVPGGGGSNFSAGGPVAKNDGDAGQRGRAQISEAARERTGLRSLNLDEMLLPGIDWIRLSENLRGGAQA
jgi:hypothetical protein